MDTFFVSHGSPMIAVDECPMKWFLKSWSENVLTEKPKAILIISAHWDASEPTVNTPDRNTTIYDFHGFPKRLYQLKYPAPGAPELAQRVKELLTEAGIMHVKEDTKRGLDHGAWIPLLLMYPACDIPVCQLSIQMNKDASYHYNMGRALAPLREEGVLIIGSGNATHNTKDIRPPEDSPVASWALTFDTWLKDALLSGRHEEVNDYEEKAPYGKMAHPWPDHFFPLHVALGAAGEGAKAKLLHHNWSVGTISYASYRFTPA